MKRKITIGKKSYECEVNGLTPVDYRDAFNKDIFIELASQLDLVNEGKVEEVDQNIFSRMAFIFTGAYERGEDYRKWLKGFGAFDMQMASGDLMELWEDSAASLNNEDEKPKNE